MSLPEIDTVRLEALALPELERAALARELVASLDGPSEPGLAEAWDIELCRRINEIESGEAKLLDIADVMHKARSRLTKN